MAILLKEGSPLPYELKAIQMESGQRLQHAVMTCFQCGAVTKFPWIETNNPNLIVKKFERSGWLVHQRKARCYDCGIKRKQQQAQHARRPEMSEVRKPVAPTTQPKPIENVGPPNTWMLTLDTNTGMLKLTAIFNAQEMIFGDRVYLVIPK